MRSLYLFIAGFFLTAGVIAQNNVTFTYYNQTTNPVFTTNSFRGITFGKWKHIWVGTTGNGIYEFNGTTWVKGSVLTTDNIRNLTHKADSSVVIGHQGHNAVQATTGGIDVFPDTLFNKIHYGMIEGLPSRYCNSVCVDKNGMIWAGMGQDLTGSTTDEGGVAYLYPGNTNFYKITSGLPSSDIRIYAIATGTNEVWAGIDRACPPGGCIPGGVLRYTLSGSYIGKYDATNSTLPFSSTSSPLIRAVAFSSNNVGWVATNAGGLYALAGGVWYTLTSGNTRLPAGAVVNANAMRGDKTGRMYIGTTLGLLVYTGGPIADTSSYRLYTTANGLPNNSVTGIEPYDYKTVWMTTAGGIAKMEETFLPNPNGWRFANSSANMWPASWFFQFHYDIDPYLGPGSDFPLKGGSILPSKSFPDWPLFVQLVGESQCYRSFFGFKFRKSIAEEKYLAIVSNKWGGSCQGFVETSYMVWDSIQRFKNVFPAVGPWRTDNLYDVPLTDASRKAINLLMIAQFQSPYYAFGATRNNVTPNQTLAAVKDMLKSNTRNLKGLNLYNQNGTGAHIVNAYKTDKDPVNPAIEYIFVYDNNYPNDFTRKVTINTTTNTWTYNLSVNSNVPSSEWGGPAAIKGLNIDTTVRYWYNPIDINNIAKKPQNYFLPFPGNLEIYTADSCNVLATNTSGQHIGYQGGLLVNTIPDALPMLSTTSEDQYPKGYYLPDGEYTVSLSNFTASNTSFKLFNNSNTFGYYRTATLLGQNDIIHTSSEGILVNNPDNVAKTLSMYCVFEDADGEMNVEVNSLGNNNANSGLQIFNGKQVKLYNSGIATQYNVKIRYLSANGESRFIHDDIPIQANTTHIITPDWENLKTALLKVYADNGSNFTIEDTLYFGNSKPPMFLAYPLALNKGDSASIDTINITNIGGSSLNWSVVSSDTSWLKIIGLNSGTNTGYIIVSTLQDTAGSRSGMITFTAAGASNSPYSIKVKQKGLLDASASILNASDGAYADGVHISWTTVAGASWYKLFRSEAGGSNGNALTGWINVSSYIDTTCNKGQYYYYSILAANDSLGKDSTDFSMTDDGWRKGFSVDFSYSGQCSGQAVSFTETSTAHEKVYYHWDINNDGSIDLSGPNVSYTFNAPGSYPVLLIATDSISPAQSILKTVTINSFPAISLFSDSTICAGQAVTLNAGNGFASYLWSTGATTASINVDSTGYGYGLYAFTVQVTTINGCSAIATARVNWDSCTVIGSFNLSGTVNYDNTAQSPMSNTTVTLKQGGATLYQSITDGSGNYNFNNLQTGTYLLSGNTNKAWGGVNAVDALKVIRHFVGLSTLTGVRLMAADVNASGFINSSDALLISRRFVSLDTTFIAGNWAFEKDTVIIGGQPNQVINLKTVCFGDVDATYAPPAKEESILSQFTSGIVSPDKYGNLEIPLSLNTSSELCAVSLVLNFPSEYLELKDVNIKQKGNLVYNIIGNELRIAWYSLTPIELLADETFLSLRCHCKNPASLPLITLNLDPSSQLADDNAELLIGVQVNIPDIVMNSSSYYLGQNSPNPFKQTSTISWIMPEAGKVSLTLYDIAGNKVKTLVNTDFTAGAHTYILDASGLRGGSYTYHIEIDGKEGKFMDTKQMVIIK